MVKYIWGGASFTDQGKFNTQESREKATEILLAHKIKNIDTARLYPGSEVAIGALDKRTQFTIDTKLVGGFGAPGTVSKENVLRDIPDSLSRVGIKQFDVLYIHAPDTSVPFAETIDGINEMHKKGLFRRFGLSNFTGAQVQEVYDISEKNGWVKPTVYQGNYNPVARHAETELFPLLKKLGIAYYAYSPIAGGFLTKTAADLDSGAGRFNAQAIGGLYVKLYDKPEMREALVKWNAIAEDEGVAKAELAYRYVAFHSKLAGDDFAKGEENGVIFGASSHGQIEGTLEGLERGKLSEKAVQGIEEIWESVRGVAPLDNFSHEYKK
jgi:aflatoxin B1 aldehyde reductase